MLIEESVVDVSVNETIDDGRAVTLLKVLKHLCNVRNFDLEALCLKSGTSDAVSVYNYLIWQSSIVHLLIVSEGLNHEVL